MLESIIKKINYWLHKPIELHKPIDASLLKKDLKIMGIIPQNIKIAPYFITVILILFLLNYYWMAVILIGMTIFFYIFFKNRALNEEEKSTILILIIVFNYFFVMFIAYNMLKEPQGWLIIFLLINIFNLFFLSILIMSGVIRAEEVSDKQVEKEELFVEISILVLIFLISQYVFNHYWAITFSICLLYSATLVDLSNKIIIKKLLKR